MKFLTIKKELILKDLYLQRKNIVDKNINELRIIISKFKKELKINLDYLKIFNFFKKDLFNIYDDLLNKKKSLNWTNWKTQLLMIN